MLPAPDTSALRYTPLTLEIEPVTVGCTFDSIPLISLPDATEPQSFDLMSEVLCARVSNDSTSSFVPAAALDVFIPTPPLLFMVRYVVGLL